MNPVQLKEMNEITWWHQIELDGVVTPGRDHSSFKLQITKMPEDLTGKTVLDVGAWDGFMSFEAEKRGADVFAIDIDSWDEGPLFHVEHDKEVHHTGKRGFDFAHKILNSNVKSERINVFDLDSEFDLVLCLGVLYHMEHPLKLCQKLAELTKDMLILETHMDMEGLNGPAMKFYPNKEWNNDPGTWWGPNPSCVIAMLKVAGFEKAEMVFDNNHRGVFHAWKKK